jgi:hypothetical protein
MNEPRAKFRDCNSDISEFEVSSPDVPGVIGVTITGVGSYRLKDLLSHITQILQMMNSAMPNATDNRTREFVTAPQSIVTDSHTIEAYSSTQR